MLSACFRNGGKLLVCGNGGSAADSEHIVGELMKGFVLRREIPEDLKARLRESQPADAEHLISHLQCGLPAISLVSHTALLTAFANDSAADLCLAQQVLGYGKAGDVLLAISASGRSRNVVYAAEVAQAIGVKVIGLTGQGGGKLARLCDCLLDAPETETYKIQELHSPIYHTLCLALENEFFGDRL
jgi:D-sedoheptulose 7-phosphate isomerase